MSTRITLSDEETAVLFDFLSRTLDVENGDNLARAAIHDGELWALNGVLGMLEKSLSLPFDPDYASKIAAARDTLVTQCGAWPTSD